MNDYVGKDEPLAILVGSNLGGTTWVSQASARLPLITTLSEPNVYSGIRERDLRVSGPRSARIFMADNLWALQPRRLPSCTENVRHHR